MTNEMNKPFPKVAIILLNYNNYRDTFNCLDSLKELTYSNYETIVVDNNSSNDSLHYLRQRIDKNLTVIDSGRNGGFAFGNNIGIQKALEDNADYIMLLNNDTLVTPDFLEKLLSCFYDSGVENVGVATCRIMYNDARDKVWYAGGTIDWENLRATHNSIGTKQYKSDGVEVVGFASGCCMLISAECIQKAGILPEEYFMYYEDLDYCVKVHEAGYQIKYNPEAVIYHCVSSSGGGENSPFVIEWSNRARRIFYNKYKRYIKNSKRAFVYAKCELRTIVKIFLGKNVMKALKAYRKSFEV